MSSNKPVRGKFSADNIRYWTGDNMSHEQLYELIAELVNGEYTPEEFRKDLRDYFDDLDYVEIEDERETIN